MAGQEKDFRQIVEDAQRVTGDIGGLFGSPGRVAFERRPNRAGPEMDFEAKCSVFQLPADVDGYEDVLNQVLRGDALLRYEERHFTKEGDFIVAVCYLLPRPAPQRAPDENREAGDAEPPVRPRRDG